MKIEHKIVVQGGFEALRVVESDGRLIQGVGIMIPGKYDLGVHDRTETIQPLTEPMIINGGLYYPGSDYSHKPGDKLVIEVTAIAIYQRT